MPTCSGSCFTHHSISLGILKSATSPLPSHTQGSPVVGYVPVSPPLTGKLSNKPNASLSRSTNWAYPWYMDRTDKTVDRVDFV